MQVVAHAQQKVVGGFELFPLAFADQPALFQFGQGPRPVFEKGHPDQVLKIAQTAAAVLDVRLLHRRGIAELRPPRLLVRQASLDMPVFGPAHAPGQHHRLHVPEQLLVAGDKPRFDQRRLRLHVAIGNFDAIVHRPHRMADLQADVPQRVKHTVGERRQKRVRFAARRRDRVAVVQEHDLNVALRIQLAATVAADAHHRELGRRSFGFHRRVGPDRVQKVTQQHVHHRCPGPANVASADAGAMEHLEPVGFDLEKILVTRQFLRRLAA